MEDVFRSLLITSAQAALVALLVLLAQWLFRDRLSKTWRHSLWFLVVLRLVAPVLPESPTSMFHLTQMEVADKKGDLTNPSDRSEQSHQFLVGPVPDGLPFEVEAVTVQPIEEWPSMTPAVLAESRPVNYWAIAAWSWGVIALLLGLRMLIGHVLFCRRMRTNRQLDDARFEKLFAECCELSGCRANVRPEETDAIESPALYGLIRPRLLLPAGLLDRFSDEELKYILLHELAHVRRGDVVFNWLETLLGLVHWFNPALLFAFQRMRADRELACDELALSWTQWGDKDAYGKTVIKLLEQFIAPKAAPGVIGILENKSRMKLRLRMIAGFTHRRRWTISAVSVLVLLSAISLTEVVSQDKGPLPRNELPETNVAQAKIDLDFTKIPGLGIDPIIAAKGRVFDVAGNQIAKAHVLVARPDESTALHEGRFWLEDDDVSTRTDAAGRFTSAHARTNHTLHIAHPKHGFVAVSIASLQTNSRVRLQPWARLKASVHADGKPLIGQSLMLGDSADRGFLLQSGGNDRIDEQGNVVITHIPPGKYFTETMGDGLVRKLDELLEFKAGEETVADIDLELRRVEAEIEVEGLDIDWGKSEHHFAFKFRRSEVAAMKQKMGQPTPYYPGWIAAHPWDSMRRFRFGRKPRLVASRIEVGWYELIIALRKKRDGEPNTLKDQFYHHRRLVEVKGDDRSETVRLPRIVINRQNTILIGAEAAGRQQMNSTYRGQVVAANGEPLRNVQVVSIGELARNSIADGGFRVLPENLPTRTDDAGGFSMTGVPAKAWMCFADPHHGFAAHRYAELRDRQKIRLQPWGGLRLSVKVNGKRLPGNPRVNLWGVNRSCVMVDYFHNQEVKEFDHLPPGSYDVSITTDDGHRTWYLDRDARVVVESAKKTVMDIDIRLHSVRFKFSTADLPFAVDWEGSQIYLRKSANDYSAGQRPPAHPLRIGYDNGVVHHSHEKVVHVRKVDSELSIEALSGRYDFLLALKKLGSTDDYFHYRRHLEITPDGNSRFSPDRHHSTSVELSGTADPIRIEPAMVKLYRDTE